MTSSIDYQALVQELKERFSPMENKDPLIQEVGAQMCRRLVHLIDVDQPYSLDEMIQQLEEKWRADGLL